ncbi:group-specific protein [Ornithinibacillus sp. 179-J 7C1 HS]|uniref:group-specific protein n=1 Tax=Ornithinibacillus sp. 179-J 7C1 HS TaxID=3142384 RepID=UPI00399FA4C0
MIEIKLDEREVKKIYAEQLEEHFNKLDNEMLFWDSKTLEEKTNLCMNTIKKEFFYDPNFPKHKIGNKWYYPAAKTKQFLLDWIEKK